MAYRMVLNETAWFGAGAIAHIVDEVNRRGYRKGLVVTDKVLRDCGVVDKVTTLLEDNHLEYALFDEVMPNPTIGVVKRGVEVFRHSRADYLLAIGGGSPQDTSKAIGIIINNPEFSDVRSLEGFAATRTPSVPIIAVPTTAGTAAEITINYVITDEEKRRKFVCIDPHDIPVVSIVDADMMASMPAALKAATGIDALTHAIEGYITRGAWEMTDMLHLKAIELIARSLRDSVAGQSAGEKGWRWRNILPAWASPTSVSDWCTAWRIPWALFIIYRTVWRMRFCFRMSWPGMPNTPAKNIAKSP
ncbi:hypothetical protein SODG_005541 [Sodalis praecaptivus]